MEEARASKKIWWSRTGALRQGACRGALAFVVAVAGGASGCCCPAMPVQPGPPGSAPGSTPLGPTSPVPTATPTSPGAPTVPVDPRAANRHRTGESFRLGGFTYRVTAMEMVDRIGNQFLNKNAGPGALFVIVKYEITNTGNETETVLAGDFEILDDHGRRFRPSSEASTTYAMAGGDNDLLVSELQPGITRASVQVFEVPEASLREGIDLRIPEKGVWGSGEAFVGMRLVDDSAPTKHP